MKQISTDIFLYYTIKGEGAVKLKDSNQPFKKSIMASPGNYTLISSLSKSLLVNRSPLFDNYFSSPTIINGRIYYWPIKQIDSTGKIKVYAAEFDPRSNKCVKYFVMDDILETDDSGYLPLPYMENDTIYFEATTNKKMKFSKDFKPYN